MGNIRVAACINIWADAVELLPYCIKNLLDCGVDGIIIIWSEASNYGEIKRNYLPRIDSLVSLYCNIHTYQREPFLHHPMNCETDKRNFGIDKAKELGYTHFLTMDQDEFYEPDQFKKVRKYIEDTGVKGIVCPSNVYFKSPTLTIGRDVTLVPFIHEIQPRIRHEFNRKYPYAFDAKGHIRIDPTRSLSITAGVEYTEDITMHHMSYIRKDIEMKIRNSTARYNIDKKYTALLTDMRLGKEGYFCEFYQKRLARATVSFGIPEFYEATPVQSI
jgi:hypothetical protein